MLKDWRNSLEVRSICREYRLLNMVMQDDWYDSIIHDTSQMMFINEICNGETVIPIGVCGWTYINWRSNYGMTSIYIGEANYRNGDYMLAVLNELHRIAFNELNLHTVRYEWYPWRDDQDVFIEAGYTESGKFRDGFYHDGKYHDIIIMDMKRDEWGGDIENE